MNVFETVKNTVTARQAAEYYGIKVTRKGMACCPFHRDRHPSMKLDQRFHCFGCQVGGDVIDFVARYFGLSTRETAKKLMDDFGVHYKSERPPDRGKNKWPVKTPSLEQNYTKLEQNGFSVLCRYRELLCFWIECFAPKKPEEEWDCLFCEALDRLSRVEYLMDVLLYSPLEERVELLLSIRWKGDCRVCGKTSKA